MNEYAWRVCGELPPSLVRAGLGGLLTKEPIYSARDDAWYARRDDGAAVRYGLGTLVDFQTAQLAVDRMNDVIAQGDAQFAQGNWALAIGAYKTAAATTSILGPQIDAAGAREVTAPIVAGAALLVPQVLNIATMDQASAQQAQDTAYRILNLLNNAIVVGKTKLSAPPPAPTPPPAPKPAPAEKKTDYTPALVVAGVLAAGLVGWAFWPSK